MRARIVAVNGVPIEQVHTTPDTSWALRGDRGLTYAATPPPGTRIVAGKWWPPDYSGPPLVSFDAGLAQGWGSRHRRRHPGQRARPRRRPEDREPARHRLADAVAELRHGREPRPAAGARRTPTSRRCAWPTPEQGGAAARRDRRTAQRHRHPRGRTCLPPWPRCWIRSPPRSTATGSLTLIAGALVLVGAVAAGQRRRTREAVILKTLGATRGQIRAAWLVEFGVLGLAAGSDRGPGRDPGELRRGPLHHAHRLGVPAGHACGHRDRVSRHDAGLRLCWHCGRAAGQGGAHAAERVKAGRPPAGVTKLSLPAGLNRPGRSPN